MAIVKYDNLGNSNNRSVFLAVLEVESPDSRHEQIIFLVSVTFLVPQLPFFCIFLRMGEMGEFSRTRMTRQLEMSTMAFRFEWSLHWRITVLAVLRP